MPKTTAKKPAKPTPKLVASPDPLPGASSVTITGSGFDAGQEVILDDGHMNPNDRIAADGHGAFVHTMAYTYPVQTTPAPAAVRALVEEKNGNWAEVAIAKFTVTG